MKPNPTQLEMYTGDRFVDRCTVDTWGMSSPRQIQNYYDEMARLLQTDHPHLKITDVRFYVTLPSKMNHPDFDKAKQKKAA